MTARPQHTPEPWPSRENDEHRILYMIPDDYRHARACVNACAGLNPEAIPALIEAAERALAFVASMPDADNVGLAYTLGAALAAVRGAR